MDTAIDTTWQPTCILCAARGKSRNLQDGHCCHTCRGWLHTVVLDIGFHANEADEWISPRSSGSSGSASFGSRPPILLDAIDPELALMDLVVGDPSSSVTILDMVESWERVIREERRFAPYGIASNARARTQRANMTTTKAALIACVDFLAGQIDWIVTEPDFGLEDFSDHMRRAAAIMRRWSQADQQIGTRIACPAVTEDGESCGHALRISTNGDATTCKGCGHAWTIDWLIRVAGDDADGWADLEAVSRLSGLHERTIRRWAKAGKVRKTGLLYNVRDISEATTKATTKAVTT